MKTIIVTGCGGLVGSECARFFSDKGYMVVGIDNNMREYFFGKEGSTVWMVDKLKEGIKSFRYYCADIRDNEAIGKIFSEYSSDIQAVIHTAAQPSHDWAAKEVFTDFTVNANGTLAVLENFRKYSPGACFVFTSTNKVYGDTVNNLKFEERDSRYELNQGHHWYQGIDETMSIDSTKHSLFGVSKVSADLLVQEYGRYFHLKTGVFRCGCITGSSHSSVALHGFLHYLVKCVLNGRQYNLYGYKGKQVRDNIHSFDLVNAFYHFILDPKEGAVYNMGGGRGNSCSVLEAAALCEKMCGKKFDYIYSGQPRIGDHQWWISSLDRFKVDYPGWKLTYNLEMIVDKIIESELAKTGTS